MAVKFNFKYHSVDKRVLGMKSLFFRWATLQFSKKGTITLTARETVKLSVFDFHTWTPMGPAGPGIPASPGSP